MHLLFKLPRLLAVLAVLALPVAGASAQMLLTVDVSNPGAVTFTATGNAPSVSDTSQVFFEGIDLVGFFTSNQNSTVHKLTSTSLTTFVDGTPNFNDAVADDVTNSGGARTSTFIHPRMRTRKPLIPAPRHSREWP